MSSVDFVMPAAAAGHERDVEAVDRAVVRELPRADSVLERCRGGEPGAWRSLYLDHVDRLWRFARRIGVPPADVEDVVQEVFIVAHRRLVEFDGAVPVSTWLFAIAVRTSKAHKRRALRRRLVGLMGFSPEPLRAPDGGLERRDAEAELGEILDRMSPKKRTVFVLHELEELDGPAIAGILECSVHTVWSRLRLAREEIERIVRRKRAGGER